MPLAQGTLRKKAPEILRAGHQGRSEERNCLGRGLMGPEWSSLTAPPLSGCPIMIDVLSDIRQHPSPASHAMLVPGRGRCPDLVKHVM